MKSKVILWSAASFNIIVLIFTIIWGETASWAGLVAIFNFILIWLLNTRITRFLGELRSALWKTKVEGNNNSEIIAHIKNIVDFTQAAELAIAGISEIGQEQFAAKIGGIKNEAIRTSLLSANDKIIELRRKESENNWITQGVASVTQLKQKGNDIADYSLQVISTVVKYLNANQGGFFLLKEDGDKTFFELTACYAYGKKKFIEKRINPGEGLIGQVYFEREFIYMTEVPKDYIKITSGLGEALPRCVCIVPLLSENTIHGAIEIASFNKLLPAEMEYLKKIAESIGYNLNSIKTHKRTEILLEESQKMSLEIRAQEEELRQNMEELTATQEQMKRKQIELDAVMTTLSTLELDVAGNIADANPIFLGITGYTFSDIQGRSYKSLIPQHGNDLIQYEMMWSSILSGKSFSGEFRIINKVQKEMWMVGNFTPLINESSQPYKIMVISLFTTQDKEKLFELQETLTAIKNCFPIAEINPDLTFKSANDLFLSELGIKRLDLKKIASNHVFINESFDKLKEYIINNGVQSAHILLDVRHKNGTEKKFSSTLININGNKANQNKALLILKNAL